MSTEPTSTESTSNEPTWPDHVFQTNCEYCLHNYSSAKRLARHIVDVHSTGFAYENLSLLTGYRYNSDTNELILAHLYKPGISNHE